VGHVSNGVKTKKQKNNHRQGRRRSWAGGTGKTPARYATCPLYLRKQGRRGRKAGQAGESKKFFNFVVYLIMQNV